MLYFMTKLFLIIHSSVEWLLVLLQFLDIINLAAMNMVEKVSLWQGPLSFGYVPE